MLYISGWKYTPGRVPPVAEMQRGLAAVEAAEEAARKAFEFANEWAVRGARDKHARAWQDLKDLRQQLAHDIAILGDGK